MSLRSVSKIFKALSDPTRLKILIILTKRSFCVCELTVALGLSQSTVTRHLQQLEAAGFLSSEKNGSWVIYRLDPANEEVSALLELVIRWLYEDKDLKKLTELAALLNRDECSKKIRETFKHAQE